MKQFTHVPLELPYSDLSTTEINGRRHYEIPSGKKFPSITTVLSECGDKEFLEEWLNRVGQTEATRITHHACTRGTAIHLIAENYLNNLAEPIPKGTMPHVKFGFKSIKKALDKSVDRVVMQECPLFSNRFEVAGRTDLIAEWNGVPAVIDFKTAKHKKTKDDILNYLIQLSFYAFAFFEQTGILLRKGVIIMAVDGMSEPVVFEIDHSEFPAYLEKLSEMREQFRAKIGS